MSALGAEVSAGALGRIQAIDHIVLAATDLVSVANDLSCLLGRAPSWRGSHPSMGTENVLFRLGRLYIEVLAPVGEGLVADALRHHLEAQGEGLFAIALQTDDVEACADLLRNRGLSPSDPSAGSGTAQGGAVRHWRTVFLPTDETRGVNVFVVQHITSLDELAEAPVLTQGTVQGVDHVVIMSADADATRDLYREGLAIRLALDKEFPAWGARQLFFKIDGVVLEVGASLEPPVDPLAPDQLWGLCWRTPDIDAARQRLMDVGWSLSEVRDGRKPGTRVCTVRDHTHGVATLLLSTDPAPTT